MYSIPLIQRLRDDHFALTNQYIEVTEKRAENIVGRDWISKVEEYFEKFYDSSLHSSNGNLYNELLLEAMMVYQNSAIPELFAKLPKVCRDKIVAQNKTLSADVIENYLRALLLLEMPDTEFLMGATAQSESVYKLSRSKNSYAFMNPNTVTLSSEFKKVLQKAGSVYNPDFSFKRDTILMFRAYYGEALLAEIYKREFDEDVELSFENFCRLIIDWDSMKDYPLSWSLQVLD